MKTPVLFLSMILLTAGAVAQEQLSLQRAEELVLQSPRLAASEAMVRTAEARQSTSNGMFYPALTLSHGYMRTDDPVGVFGSKLQQGEFTQADFALTSLNDPASINHWRTRVELAQPILHSFTDLHNRRAAEEGTQAQKTRHRFNAQEARLQTAKIYYTAVAFNERGRILNDGIEQLTRLEKSYSLMEAPTAATTTNFLIAQSVRLGLSAHRSGIQSGEASVLRRLSALLGVSPGNGWKLTDPLPPVPAQTPSLEPAPTRADVEAARLDRKAASTAVKAANSEWGPNLDAVAGYNVYTGSYEDFAGAYDVGVWLTWPIFRGPRLGQGASAKAQLKVAEQMEKVTELDAVAAHENAAGDFTARIAEFRILREAEDKASKALDLAGKRYAQGTLPLFDYSHSIENWTFVRQEVIEAQRRVAEAQKQLDFERGAL